MTTVTVDESTSTISLGDWTDAVPALLESLKLTDIQSCNDVKAIGSKAREEKQLLIINLDEAKYIGQLRISFRLIENTDNILLYFARTRTYK